MPVTVARNAGQYPMYYARNNTHRPESAGDGLFTSRYWDTQSSPLFSFGFGLGYTNFKFCDLALDRAEKKKGEVLRVSVKVKNTGSVTGDEVVQMYLHQRYGSDSRPMRLLKDFRRITLQPGEESTVEFAVTDEMLTYWSSAENAYVLDESDFDLWIGNGSGEELHAEFKTV